jgi:acetyltransferase-like isoleucine patch superfamily enzyme
VIIEQIERQVGDRPAVVLDRIRAAVLRWRGARIGARTRVGSGCVVHRPWTLRTGERCQFEHNVFIKAAADSARVELGREVFVGFNSELDVSDGLFIGDGVLIAPGCFITDHDHRRSPLMTIASQGCESRPVRLEDDVWLGAHVVVLAGVTIGRGAVVAAGAVVTEDVAPMTVVGGVPARVISVRGKAPRRPAQHAFSPDMSRETMRVNQTHE